METKRGLETYLRIQLRFFSIMDKNHTDQVGELQTKHLGPSLKIRPRQPQRR